MLKAVTAACLLACVAIAGAETNATAGEAATLKAGEEASALRRQQANLNSSKLTQAAVARDAGMNNTLVCLKSVSLSRMRLFQCCLRMQCGVLVGGKQPIVSQQECVRLVKMHCARSRSRKAGPVTVLACLGT